MLCQQSKYALRAVMYLKQQPEQSLVRVEDIAREANLPAPYLSKILKALARGKIIVSRRGKNGGVRLNRARGEISFFDICSSVEDPIVRSECVLFKQPCDKNAPCPFHSNWASTKENFLSFLENTRLDSPDAKQER